MLQENSIYQQINSILRKQSKISFLKEDLLYTRIEEHNSLTLTEKLAILEHTIDVEDEQGNITPQHDACDFLLVTIAMHFVGNPKEELSSSKIFLTNLRCPTLSDFRRKDFLKKTGKTFEIWGFCELR